MTNQEFKLFKDTVKPGDILFIAGDDFIAKVIQFGQSLLDPMWTNQISHAAFVDSDLNIQESSLGQEVRDGKKMLTSGVMIRPLDAWNDSEKLKWLFIMRLDGLTPEKVKAVSDKGKYLHDKRVQYAFVELAGTLVSELNYKFLGLFKKLNPKYIDQCQQELLKKHNPLDEKNQMYCISFVNHCFESQGLRVIPISIEESQCKVGDGLKNKDRAYQVIFIHPAGIDNYTKKAGEEFNFNPIK